MDEVNAFRHVDHFDIITSSTRRVSGLLPLMPNTAVLPQDKLPCRDDARKVDLATDRLCGGTSSISLCDFMVPNSISSSNVG